MATDKGHGDSRPGFEGTDRQKLPTAPNPWKTKTKAEVYDNPWIRVTEHEVVNPSGRPGIYGTVHYKNLAIGILPIDANGALSLVGQWRFPLSRYSWELPEGGGAGQPPLLAAQRELAEETGLSAANWLEFMRMDLSNAVSDEHAICFLAWDLRQGQASPEDTEAIDRVTLPVWEAVDRARSGEITDAISVAALMRLRADYLDGRLPRAVADLLGS